MQSLVGYHGTPWSRSVFYPTMPKWRGEDGQEYDDSNVPVIRATQNALPAVFMALAPQGKGRYGYRYNKETDRVAFYAEKQDRTVLTGAVGYVAVFQAGDFVLTELGMPEGWPGPTIDRLPELRRKTPLAVGFLIKVRYVDFEQLLEAEPGATMEYRDQAV